MKNLKEALDIMEDYLHRSKKTPGQLWKAWYALRNILGVTSTVKEPAFTKAGRCEKCGSWVSFADVRDTLVFVGEDIVERHDGDISNRNCVRCVYPELYSEYAAYDDTQQS